MALTVAQPVQPGLSSPTPDARPARSTPTRVRLLATTATVALLALLAVTAASFLQARARADTVTSRARTAAEAADLYFALADLDAEAARLVLLGDGDFQVGDGAYAGNQLSALTAYNARTAQVDSDLQSLAAGGSATSSLAAGITTYRSIADAAVGFDEFPGAAAGSPTDTASGFYSRAATQMQNVVLPAAAALRNSTAAASTSASADAHGWALAGLIGTLVLGLSSVLALVSMQRRFARMFRRVLNPALLAATTLTVVLVGGAALSLNAAARDSSAAGSRLTSYLQVVETRADSYNAEGTAVRDVVFPFLTSQTGAAPLLLTAQSDAVGKELSTLNIPANLVSRWPSGPAADYAKIISAVQGGGIAAALTEETGIEHGQDAYDFYYYDLGLQSISDQRLSSFQQAANGLSADLRPWLWLPWAFAGAALVLVGVGIRPRLAEYR